jgi:hypothetical protein
MMANTVNTEALANAIIVKMKEEHHVFWIDPEVHAEQHAFLALLMKEREEREARRRRLEEKIAGSFVLSALALIVTLLGAAVMQWLRKNLNGVG